MPIIIGEPQGSNPFPDSPAATDVNPERFGRDAAALAGLGGEIADFGSRLIKARKDAIESDAVAQAQHEDLIWITQRQDEIQLSHDSNRAARAEALKKAEEEGNPFASLEFDSTTSNDVTGSAERLRQEMELRFQERMNAMPTGDAQRAYRDRMQPLMDKTYIASLAWENQTRAESFLENTAIRYNQAAQYLNNRPSIDTANNLLNSLREDLNSKIGTLINADQAQKLYRMYGRQYILALFEGYSNNVEGAKDGLALLNNISKSAPIDPKTGDLIIDPKKSSLADKDGLMRKIHFGLEGDPTIIQGVLHATDLQDIRNKLDAKIGVENNRKVRDVVNGIKDIEAALVLPDNFLKPNSERDPLFSSEKAIEYLDFIQDVAKDPKSSISVDDANRMRMTIHYAMAMKDVREKIHYFSPNDKEKFDKLLEDSWKSQVEFQKNNVEGGTTLDNPAFAAADRLRLDQMREGTWSAIMAARNKDPAGYVEKYFGHQYRGQNNGGLPTAQRISERLSTMQTLGMSKQSVLTDGERSSLSSFLKKNAEQSPEAAAGALEAIKRNTGRYAGLVIDELGGDQYFKTAFYMPTSDAAASVIGNSRFKKDLEEGFKLKFGKDVVREFDEELRSSFIDRFDAFAGSGSYSRNIKFANGLQDAVRMEAMRQMVTDGVDQETALANASSKIVDQSWAVVGKTFVPRRIGEVDVNMAYVNGHMQQAYNPEWVLKQNVSIPKGFVEKDPKVQANSFAIAVKNGRWVTENTGLGARFEVPLKKGQWVPVMKKDGKPLRIDFAETSLSPPQEALDYNKGWFK